MFSGSGVEDFEILLWASTALLEVGTSHLTKHTWEHLWRKRGKNNNVHCCCYLVVLQLLIRAIIIHVTKCYDLRRWQGCIHHWHQCVTGFQASALCLEAYFLTVGLLLPGMNSSASSIFLAYRTSNKVLTSFSLLQERIAYPRVVKSSRASLVLFSCVWQIAWNVPVNEVTR